MSLSLKTRKLQTFEICVLASRPQTSEAYLSATRGQIRLQFWIFAILIDPNKHTKFHENLRWSLPTLPKSGWFDMEWHSVLMFDPHIAHLSLSLALHTFSLTDFIWIIALVELIDISWLDWAYKSSTCDVMYRWQCRHLYYGGQI
jgi:hypothetical protein